MIGTLYVDASELLNPRLTGIQRYTVRVIQSLAHMTRVRLVTPIPWDAACWHNWRLTRLCAGYEIEVSPANVPSSALDVKAWRNQVIRLPNRPIDPAELGDAACLLPWCPEFLPRFSRQVGIVYDMTPLILPRTVSSELYELFGEYCEQDLRRFDGMLAISHATKSDVAWLAGIHPSRIEVAYPGPSQCLDSHLFQGRCRRAPGRLLVVGAHHPRKNTQFLLDWFFTSDALPENAELWWAGPRSRSLDTAQKQSRTRGRCLRILGEVSDVRLCRLYQDAGCTIYPTLYEGFGFPVLDSLLHGTPVLCSYNSSLAEFAGPGVFYFDPCDPASLDQAWKDYRSAWPCHVKRDDLHETCRWDNVARTLLRLCA
jgi:glycosyltransferase involved in cell wall biosynthesis